MTNAMGLIGSIMIVDSYGKIKNMSRENFMVNSFNILRADNYNLMRIMSTICVMGNSWNMI